MSNKQIIQKYTEEVWHHHNLEHVNEIFAENAIIHSPFNTKKGSYTMYEIVQKWWEAFPDLNIMAEDYIAEGDKVVCRWKATATHMGSFFDTSPTHREVAYSGVTTYKLHEGQVVEYWALVDMHAILNQLQEYQHMSEVVDP